MKPFRSMASARDWPVSLSYTCRKPPLSTENERLIQNHINFHSLGQIKMQFLSDNYLLMF